MSFCIWRNWNRIKFRIFNNRRKIIKFIMVKKFAFFSRNSHISSSSSMSDDPCMNAKPSSKEWCSWWKTRSIRCITISKNGPFFSNFINIRCSVSMIPITTKMIGSTRIYIKIDNSHYNSSQYLIIRIVIWLFFILNLLLIKISF